MSSGVRTFVETRDERKLFQRYMCICTQSQYKRRSSILQGILNYMYSYIFRPGEEGDHCLLPCSVVLLNKRYGLLLAARGMLYGLGFTDIDVVVHTYSQRVFFFVTGEQHFNICRYSCPLCFFMLCDS